MRSFLAIPLSENTRDNLGKCRDSLRPAGRDIKWVENENFHITLVFLGDISRETAGLIIKGMQDLTAELSPFHIILDGIGAFPTLKKPRVIWAGVREGNEEIKKVHRKVDMFVQSLGFEGNERFSPHVTLGRVRTQANPEVLISQSKKIGELGKEHVRGISLMESTLTPKGPIYSEVAYFKFRKDC